MKKRFAPYRAWAVVAVLFATPALADAPITQYKQFDDHDVTITDLETGLVWQRTAGPALPYAAAKDGCAQAQQRLPTLKELLTLVDESPHKEYAGQTEVTVFIDPSAFGGKDLSGRQTTPVDAAYWTQTPAAAGHWSLDFATGIPAAAGDTSSSLHVRCVADQ